MPATSATPATRGTARPTRAGPPLRPTPRRDDPPAPPAARSGEAGFVKPFTSAEAPATATEAIVAASGVRKVYRGGTEVEALRGVSLRVGRGEMVAVVGPSGSGKTTLLNCLSGLERIDGGEILIDGRSLAALSDDDRTEHRARSMGFVFQAFNLLPVLSAVENVEIPLLLLGERSREARARALETLDEVGLSARAEHRPDQLSGGEQQRVAVARALVHRPSVVWADEPTGNLDTESTEAVMELLVRLNGEGQTIVLVTHNPAVAERAARTIRMRDGMIEGPPGHR
ncbi:MAG: ABC transporter ATP-binding protein [Actinobacteria bacterium]|nr:ABC transporter ATP-binding protein [Actinomycetota bacterium]